jgi:hypothetical protein
MRGMAAPSFVARRGDGLLTRGAQGRWRPDSARSAYELLLLERVTPERRELGPEGGGGVCLDLHVVGVVQELEQLDNVGEITMPMSMELELEQWRETYNGGVPWARPEPVGQRIKGAMGSRHLLACNEEVDRDPTRFVPEARPRLHDEAVSARLGHDPRERAQVDQHIDVFGRSQVAMVDHGDAPHEFEDSIRVGEQSASRRECEVYRACGRRHRLCEPPEVRQRSKRCVHGQGRS